MAPPHSAQKRIPVRRVGPLTTRAGILSDSRAQMRLHGVEGGLIDERRDRDRHHLADGFQLLGLGALVELVHACIGAARQDTVDLPDTPSPPVAGEDAVAIEIGDDLLHAEGPHAPSPSRNSL